MANIIFNGGIVNTFPVTSGIRQWCLFSPLLLTNELECLTTELKQKKKKKKVKMAKSGRASSASPHIAEASSSGSWVHPGLCYSHRAQKRCSSYVLLPSLWPLPGSKRHLSLLFSSSTCILERLWKKLRICRVQKEGSGIWWWPPGLCKLILI